MGKVFRCLAAFVLLSLTGCFSFTNEDLPSEVAIDGYSDKNELVMSRAAAAVEVARVANKDGKPDVVEDELGVAAAYLPRPTIADLDYAKGRVDKGDDEAYKKARAVADAHQRQVSELKAQVEAEKAKARAAIESKQAEMDAERALWRDILISGAGAIGVVIGLLMMALGYNRLNAATTILSGGLVAVLPWFVESRWFIWIAVPSVAFFILEWSIGVYRRLRG